ncbi:MAG: mechanosensitive ion channel [Candidatus Krumholzibacteria bacterium]|nr:mechanosensitive ion channel [Candidatus Krumholzibacteria bacterium]
MEFNLQTIVEQLGDLVVVYGLKILGAVLILIVGRIIAGLARRGLKRAMGKANADATLAIFFGRAVYVLVMVFAFIAALAGFGVQTTSFVALLGAAGLAVGLALQGSLSNFASGVMLIAFRPFKAGDFIEAGGVAGTVKAINIFTTELATPDNVKVIVPNSSVFGGTIKNFAGYETRRVEVVVGIAYGANIDRAVEVVQDLLKADERIFRDPEPQIVVGELADSSVNLIVRCWVRRENFWPVKFALTKSIKEHYDVQGIEIPFPQRVVHMAKQ